MIFEKGQDMRIVVGAVVAFMLMSLLMGVTSRAQVINGEGTFESNRGFDHAPDEATADKPAKPADPEAKPDARKQP